MDRRSALVVLFVATLATVALFAFYLIQSQAGLKSSAHGADWASHLAMIDLILRGEDVRVHRAQIGTGVVSPLFAHDIAAALSSIAGLSTIRTIGIVASLAAIVSVVAAAARSVYVVLAVAQNRVGRFSGWLVAAVAFWVFGNIGLGFYGQIDQANYFFSQTVGTAAALLAFTAVQAGMAKEGRASLLTIASVPILAFVLANIHLIPALWFAAASAVCALSLTRPLQQRLALAALIGALSVLLILSDPASREVLQLRQAAQGVLNLRLASGLFQLNAHPALLIGGLAALAALIFIVALLEEPARLRFRLLNLHAGAIAILLLGLLTLVALTIRGGAGYYGLAKYAFLFAAETALLAGHIAATALNHFGTNPAKPIFAVLALLLAIFVQQRAAPPDRRDQALLIDMERALTEIAPSLPTPAPFPLDERLSLSERLYLFTSPMEQAKDRRAQRLLGRTVEESADAGRESLQPSLIPTVVPQWSGDSIALDDIPAPSPLVFFGRWGDASGGGRLVHPPAAHIGFHIDPKSAPLELCLRLSAPSMNPGAPLSVTVAVDEEMQRQETFRAGDGTRVIGLSLAGIGPRGDAVLSLRSQGKERGEERSALALQAIWLAPACH